MAFQRNVFQNLAQDATSACISSIARVQQTLEKQVVRPKAIIVMFFCFFCNLLFAFAVVQRQYAVLYATLARAS